MRSMRYDARAVARSLLLNDVDRAWLAEDLVCVRFDQGRYAGQCQWMQRTKVYLDAPVLTAEEGMRLPADTPVIALHPNYTPMWSATLSTDRSADKVYLNFYDGDDAYQTWDNVVLPRHPSHDTWEAQPGCWACKDIHAGRYIHGNMIAYHRGGEPVPGVSDQDDPSTAAPQQQQQQRQQRQQQVESSPKHSDAKPEIRARSGTLMGRVGMVRLNVARFVRNCSTASGADLHAQPAGTREGGTSAGVVRGSSGGRGGGVEGDDDAVLLRRRLAEEEAAAAELDGGKIVVYTSGVVARAEERETCARVLALLRDGEHVEVEERDVAASAAFARELLARCGVCCSVPQVFVNGRHIGNGATLDAMAQTGKLQTLLSTIPRTA
ncbi:hypothetical protein PTSG_01839 [Salpingoeca rosetta]|uniref:Glutaredoxin domain-containing protein n=1 Tax=Salpingoeca rosetta (strain ATCC 50818 / BSB-021) TaxID=946362 RepID=F2TZ37_SALR5|nr:uncharacterized protein PTSG_01839 [Salpingoeca rosetta]EGD78861.1 hypothetical protein PTSG_01839 [Salpingoeca rosetta]|eukprot:XP_004997817.1 hypothetical protein PTSG_01839 [Salpingoeca rosetta]